VRCAWLRCFVTKLGVQSGWVDPQENQITLTAVHRVRGKVHLVGLREMDEALAGKRRRNILVDGYCFSPLGRPRNMNDKAVH
jgi:hypothetical protein